MGRASRQGGGGGGDSSGLREHWTDSHPDRHMWSPGRLAQARTQTREEYEALYGRGSGILLTWQEGNDRLFLVQPEPSAFTSADALLADYKGESLPLLRALGDGNFHLQGHRPGEIAPLDRNRTLALLEAFERELGPAGSVESWGLAEMGSADWSGIGFGTEPLAYQQEDPDDIAELRKYISGWIKEMEVGDEINLDRDANISIRRLEEGYTMYIQSTGDTLYSEDQEQLADQAIDTLKEENCLLGAEWKIGERALFGRHENAFLYIGGPINIMMIDISSQRPRQGEINPSCQMHFNDFHLHLQLRGPLSRAEAVLMRNVLASLAQDQYLFDDE